MKLLSSILFSIFLCAMVNPLSAQKQLSDGTLQYDISITSAKAEAPIANSLNGATLTIFLNSTASRTEMKSALGSEATVFDSRAGKGFILKEYSGQKLMISMNSSNWAEKNRTYENLDFTVSDAIVKIGEYSCKKAVATLPDGKVFTVYFNPAISVANKKYNNAFAQLPGLPVQYELQSGNLNFRYTLSKLNYDAVSASNFEAPRTGYRVMTYEENQQLKKN